MRTFSAARADEPKGQRQLVSAARAAGSRQRQLFTTAELRAMGVSDARRKSWLAAGILVARARGVYSFASGPLPREAEYLSAVLSTRALGLHSFSAANQLDFASFPLRPIHVIARGRPRPQPGVIVHRCRHPEQVRLVTEDGVRCTAPARTLFDLAAKVTTDQLDSALDRSVRLRRFDLADMQHELRSRPTVRGARQLAAAIGRLDETAGENRVEHERRLIALIRGSRLPPAAVNVRIGPWEVDAHWVGTRAIAEADGDRFHSSPAQIQADTRKRRQLEAWGFVLERVSWHQTIYEGEATIDRLERFVAANLAPPVPGPPPLEPWSV